MKRYINKNVYEATQERLAYLFSEFDNILVAFSGGKDSTVCLELCLDFAKNHDQLDKLAVYHLDYEAQYQMTTDFVDETFRKLDGIRRYWLCLPIKAQCAVNMTQGYWIPWEKAKKELWVREMPTYDYVINQDTAEFDYDAQDYTVQDNFNAWFERKHGKTAVVVGIRADESLNRFRAVGTDHAKKYKGRNWINGNKAYPIYDWAAEDDFVYFAKYEKPYNKLYDLYYQAGLKVDQMRVASPFNDCATATLRLYKVIDPNNWGKMVGRVNGVNFASIYGGTTAMGWKSITKPEGMTWKDYCYFLLGTLDEETRKHYEDKLNTSIKFWKEKGGALSEETIAELDGKGRIGKPNNYSQKRTVTFEEYPDDLDIKDFKSVPSYKRMCVCIMKNDYYCKYMGFAQTKEEVKRERRHMNDTRTYDTLKKRQKLNMSTPDVKEMSKDLTFKSPVYNVEAVPIEEIFANAYNPNHVAPPEMKLLYKSILEDGYTMPIVCYRTPTGCYEIVDGFHRYMVMKTHKDIYDREHGRLPVVTIDKDISNRMASTIRHNRARGTHSIELMTNIVADLVQSGMSDAWIMKNIGMDAEELLRLKQLSGLQELFKDKDFSRAWEQ